MRLFPLYLSVMVALVLGGCTHIRHYTMPDEENLMSGAGSIAVNPEKGGAVSSHGFELIDIDKLRQDNGFYLGSNISEGDLKSDKYKYHRNEVQDRLIAASNQKCGAYFRVLTSSKAQTRMGWGGLAIFLSGAASVVTPVSAARALAAGSTFSNGLLSLYDDAYFSSMTISIISTGITKRREEVLAAIQIQRRGSLVEYSVNRAIADALAYHSACNMVTGLEAAAAAVADKK